MDTKEKAKSTKNTKGSKVFQFLEAARTIFSGFSRHGLAFGGDRNYYETFGYKRLLNHTDMAGKYQRQDIAKRLIDKPADALWCNPPSFPENDKLQGLFTLLETMHNLWDTFNRADKLAGQGQYSTILLGINDGKELAKPVTPSAKSEILYMQPYSQDSLTVQQYVNDPQDPRFGLPSNYVLRGSTLTNTGQALREIAKTTTLVHWTRVVHVAEGVLEDQILGTPRMSCVYNLLDDLLKIGGGSAEIYWLNARGGLHVDVDKEMSLDSDDEDALSDEVDDYVHNLARVIRTRGTNVKTLNANVSDPSMPFKVTIALISAAMNIPQRILMGSEAGQLAAEQDRANWADFVVERRHNFGYPRIIKPFIMRLIGIGLLKPEDLLTAQPSWPEAFKLSPLERAKTSAQQARSAMNLSNAIDKVPALLQNDEARRIIALATPKASLSGPNL